MKRIFISHSSKDKEIIQFFMDDILIGALGININDIFCTSTDGTKIKSGNDWRNDIKEHLEGSKITFLIITPNYKESEICLNEMGAAWVLSGKTIPLFVEPINYDSVGLLQEVKQVEKLLDGKSLDRIKDELQTILEIPSIQIKSDRWSDKKDSFLKKTKEYIRSNPFGNPVTKEQIEYLDDQVNNLNTENQKLNIELTTLSEENKKLIKLNNGLKNALKPEDIVKIETNLLGLKSMGEFDYLCAKVKEALSKIDGSIQDLIFVEYSGKKLGVSFYNNESVLYEARARDFLAVDSLSINWNDTKTMRQIRSSLDDLKAFIEENKNDKDFSFAYDSRFENPLSLSNLGFWEEVLGIPNYFV